MKVAKEMDSPVTFSLETITPEQAAALLESRPANRKIRQSRVQALARLIEDGRWQINGQPIILNERGELLDGQHRLSAIVAANTPVICAVAYGLPDSAMQTIDTGNSRSGADVLRMERGVGNPNVVAATLALIYQWQREGPVSDIGVSIGARPQELLEILDDNPEVLDYVAIASRLVPQSLISPSVTAFCLWLFSTDDPAKAENFIASLGNGIDLEADNPIYHLREFFLNCRSKKAQVRRSTYITMIFKAWNLWRLGKPCKQLRLGKEEAFPVPVGCWLPAKAA